MKKLIVYLAVLTVCFAYTGCGSSDSSSSETEAVTTDVTTQITTTAATTTATTAKTTAATTVKTTVAETKATKAPETEPETEEETEAPAEAGGYFDSSDSYAYYGGSSFVLYQDASALPAAQSVDSAPSCMGEGEDKIFHYGAVDVYTQPSNGSEHVVEIDIVSSGASTAKGLAVGMSMSDAVALYGEGSGGVWSSGGVSMYVYESGGIITEIDIAAE